MTPESHGSGVEPVLPMPAAELQARPQHRLKRLKPHKNPNPIGEGRVISRGWLVPAKNPKDSIETKKNGRVQARKASRRETVPPSSQGFYMFATLNPK